MKNKKQQTTKALLLLLSSTVLFCVKSQIIVDKNNRVGFGYTIGSSLTSGPVFEAKGSGLLHNSSGPQLLLNNDNTKVTVGLSLGYFGGTNYPGGWVRLVDGTGSNYASGGGFASDNLWANSDLTVGYNATGQQTLYTKLEFNSSRISGGNGVVLSRVPSSQMYNTFGLVVNDKSYSYDGAIHFGLNGNTYASYVRGNYGTLYNVATNGFIFSKSTGSNNCCPSTKLWLDNDAYFYVGTIYNNGTKITSDSNLKYNITKISSVLDKLNTLGAYSYQFRKPELISTSNTNESNKIEKPRVELNSTDSSRRIGFLAQEIQRVFPELVTINPQTGYLAVDYNSMIPLLCQANKELNSSLVSLENKNKQLLDQLLVMEKRLMALVSM